MTPPRHSEAGPDRHPRNEPPPAGAEQSRKSLVDRYYATFNARDWDAWNETLDDDVEIVSDAGVLHGRVAARAYATGIVQAFPGVTVVDRWVVAESPDAVVSEFHLANPTVPETEPSGAAGPGVPWRLDGVTCEVLRLRGDRLVSLHSYYAPTATDRTPVAEVPSRAEAFRIAHRQAALRRVASQVAEGGSESDLVTVINQVVTEFAGADVSLLMRFEPDDTAEVLAASGLPDDQVVVGQHFTLDEDIRAVRDGGRALRFGSLRWPLPKPLDRTPSGNELRWCVGVPITLRGAVWGISLLASARAEQFADDTAAGIAAFTELASTALANAQANNELREQAHQQSELRKVAEIAAAGADPIEVFATVVHSASAVLDGQMTTLIRFVDETAADVLAFSGAGIPSTGERIVVDPGSVTARVQRTGRPARIDNYRESPGNRLADEVIGLRASVGVPVTVGGQLWGMLSASSMDDPLPVDTESRLTQFAGTVATVIAGAQARAELRALADEQAALRRVAELIARGADEDRIYHAVTSEAAGIINETTTLIRFDAAHSYNVVGSSRDEAEVGSRNDIAPDDDGLVSQVLHTRHPVRVERLTETPLHPQAYHLDGLDSSVGVPIVVDDRLWGVLGAVTTDRRLLTTAEQSLQQFGGLTAAAVANAEARGQLKEFADEQAALRRVAELAAHDAPAEQVLQAVAVEASGLAGVEFGMVLRYEDPDGGNRIVALDGAPDNFAVGMHAPGTGDGSVHRVWRTKRAARVDDLGGMSGLWPQMAHDRGFTASAGVPIVMRGELWGALIVAGRGDAFPRALEHHLAHFAELAGTAIAATDARQELRVLADEQAALRRVAELAAHEAPADEVLAAVAREASTLAGVDFTTLLRYEPDGSTEIMALDGAPDGIVPGMRSPGTGDGAVQRVWQTGRPARIEDLAEMSGVWPKLAHRHGFNASAAVPIVIHGGLWGALVVVGRREAFPLPIEQHLANFAELAATAMSAADARRELRLLADEQAALRRVAELVAHGAALDEVFTAIANEASKLLGGVTALLMRYDDADVAITVAGHNSPAPPGRRTAVTADNPLGDIRRTRRPVRIENFEGTSLTDFAAAVGAGTAVAVPVTIEGRVWGALTVSTAGPPIPIGAEDRLVPFAELAAAAIANAENKTKLTASRARVVATADETRRRLQRDVHDGAQQRLVHTIIALKLARDVVLAGEPPMDLLAEALGNAERANKELRDIVRGILPASLTRSGLRTGLESLVADLALPVDLRVTAPRLPAHIETTAYFIVAEATTNVVKHAHATQATITANVDGHTLVLEVQDDGVGGADPLGGTGLTGLLDRVEASNGTLTVTSEPGAGTTIRATLPLAHQSPELPVML